jgi:hypothetical protein
MVPPVIARRSIRHQFDRIKTLDDGNGGGNGALNGGVYVVRSKACSNIAG